ncbi:MAG: sirohydrochlorin chelatase [Bryobacteraceae bacterium]
MMSTGLVIFAHGSSVEAANEAVRRVARAVAGRSGFDRVETAFLEMASPDLPEAIQRLRAQGIRRVVVMPYFLTPGIHIRRDLPRIVESISNIHQDVEIQVSESLEGHPALADIVLARAEEIRSAWLGEAVR